MSSVSLLRRMSLRFISRNQTTSRYRLSRHCWRNFSSLSPKQGQCLNSQSLSRHSERGDATNALYAHSGSLSCLMNSFLILFPKRNRTIFLTVSSVFFLVFIFLVIWRFEKTARRREESIVRVMQVIPTAAPLKKFVPRNGLSRFRESPSACCPF